MFALFQKLVRLLVKYDAYVATRILPGGPVGKVWLMRLFRLSLAIALMSFLPISAITAHLIWRGTTLDAPAWWSLCGSIHLGGLGLMVVVGLVAFAPDQWLVSSHDARAKVNMEDPIGRLLARREGIEKTTTSVGAIAACPLLLLMVAGFAGMMIGSERGGFGVALALIFYVVAVVAGAYALIFWIQDAEFARRDQDLPPHWQELSERAEAACKAMWPCASARDQLMFAKMARERARKLAARDKGVR